MSLFSFFNTQKKELHLVFNIGGSGVSGAVVEIKNDFRPKIIYSVRQSEIFSEKPDAEKMIGFMSKALESVAKDLHDKGIPFAVKETGMGISLGKIFCVLSSSLYWSKIKTCDFKKDKQFILTDKILKEIINSNSNSSPSSTAEGKAGDLNSIENKVIDIRLNGYEIANPINMPAREAKVTVLNCMCPAMVTEVASQSIGKYFHGSKLDFHSFSSVAYHTFKNYGPAGKNFISAEVGGETTELLIVRNGTLSETGSFGLGRNDLLRSLSKELRVTTEEGSTYLAMLHSGKINQALGSKVISIINNYGKGWLAGVKKVLSFVPIQNAVVFSEKDFAWIFSNLLKDGSVVLSPATGDSALFSTLGFSVVTITDDTLKDFCEFGPQTSSGAFLSAESIYLSKIYS